MKRESPVSKISYEEVLKLLHPSIFELIGALKGVRDEIYYFDHGQIKIDRDFNTIQIHVSTKDNKEIVFFKIRDRRFDGTPNFDSPLNTWFYNSPYDIVNVKTVELSRYSRDPKLYFPNSELMDFMCEPFNYIFGDPKLFLELWENAFVTGHYPGQSALPLKGAAKYFTLKSIELADKLGYEVTVSPSHYYVAKGNLKNGFCFQSSTQEREFNELDKMFSEFALDETMIEQQKSWIILLQKFPSLLESRFSHYWLHGLEYPLYYDGKTVENVWLCQKGHKCQFNDFIPEKCLARLNKYETSRIKK